MSSAIKGSAGATRFNMPEPKKLNFASNGKEKDITAEDIKEFKERAQANELEAFEGIIDRIIRPRRDLENNEIDIVREEL